MDTIKLLVDRQHLPTFYDTFFKASFECDSWYNRKLDQTFLFADFGKMRLKLSPSKLIVEGSLTKQVLGDNLKHASLKQLSEEIVALSNVLDIDLFQSKVSRLDIAINLVTQNPIEEYLPVLSDLPKFKRKQISETLYFGQGGVWLAFYDKIKEMNRDKEVRVPEEFKVRHVLRYECRFLDEKAFIRCGLKNPCLDEIFENYSAILDYSNDLFKSIIKVRSAINLSPELFSGKGNLFKYLQLKGLQSEGGLTSMLNMVELAKARRYFVKYPNESSNLKKKLRDIASFPHLSAPLKLAEELEDKVKMQTWFAQETSKY